MGDLTVTFQPAHRDERGRFQPGHPDYGAGAPTLYDDAIADAICEHVRNGTTPRYAAMAAGINPDTLYVWRTQRAQFADRLARALADCMASCSHALLRAAAGDPTYKGDWKAALEVLKRRDPGEWGDVVNLNQIPTPKLYEIMEASRQRMEPITEDGQPAIVSGEDAL